MAKPRETTAGDDRHVEAIDIIEAALAAAGASARSAHRWGAEHMAATLAANLAAMCGAG